MQSKFQQRQEAVNNIRQGFAEQRQETKVQAESKNENVLDIDFNEHRKLTGEEKETLLTQQADAIMQLTERLNKLEGGQQ
ncbi:hypothetical protein [Oceanobacillus rekensis]|uniref:hypothetical protein n=1 Tax=Oceanobacillus rekensis TaxID=937927 RepID=UPI000B445A56|nr:hypothetical protein [Oceanobacillus rekensis]